MREPRAREREHAELRFRVQRAPSPRCGSSRTWVGLQAKGGLHVPLRVAREAARARDHLHDARSFFYSSTRSCSCAAAVVQASSERARRWGSEPTLIRAGASVASSVKKLHLLLPASFQCR